MTTALWIKSHTASLSCFFQMQSLASVSLQRCLCFFVSKQMPQKLGQHEDPPCSLFSSTPSELSVYHRVTPELWVWLSIVVSEHCLMLLDTEIKISWDLGTLWLPPDAVYDWRWLTQFFLFSTQFRIQEKDVAGYIQPWNCLLPANCP